MDAYLWLCVAPIRDLASRTGLHETHWSRIDNGQKVREQTINQIAQSLSLPPHDVLRGINHRRQRLAAFGKSG